MATRNLSNEHHVRTFITEVLGNASSAALDQVPVYCARTLTSRVDGLADLDFESFRSHLLAQRMVLSKIEMTIERCISSGDMVATVHRAHAWRKDGGEAEARIIMVCRVGSDGLITRCDEVHDWLSGTGEDADLGHRIE